MGNDTKIDEQRCSCKLAPIEKLNEMVRWFFYGLPKDDIDPKDFLCEKKPQDINWKNLRYLQIIGDNNSRCLKEFNAKGIVQGFHLNASGDWLLIILPPNTSPADYLKLCGTDLELLAIHNVSISKLSGLGQLTGLVKLDLAGCESLKSLTELEKLTHLTTLDLSGCSSLTSLTRLDALTQLTELFLSGCTSLTTLPEGLRYCRNLRFLDLNHLQLHDLPDWLPDISELFTTEDHISIGHNKAAVWLFDTTIDAIPETSIFDQPYEIVVEWFKKRRLSLDRTNYQLCNPTKIWAVDYGFCAIRRVRLCA